jgi:hypothetical protein
VRPKYITMIVVNFVTPKAAAKLELLASVDLFIDKARFVEK